jgi:DNA-binding response OmpR family regulator
VIPLKDSHAPRVLIVDDDPETVDTFARVLRLEAFEVETAFNSETALLAVSRGMFEAMLLDLRMTLLDGLELLRRLRTLPTCHHTPVAIVTGNYFIDNAVIDELSQLGAIVRYKPLWGDDLITLVRTLVASHHSD